jgi:thiol-disulfide isomerase/thioredoxin
MHHSSSSRPIRFVKPFLLMLGGSVALATPPTDEQIEQAIESYDRLLEAAPDRFPDTLRRVADEALAGIEFAEMPWAQLEHLLETSESYFYSSRRDEVESRLAKFTTTPDVSGARATLHRFNFVEGKDVEAQHSIIKAILEHPARDEALKDAEQWATFMNFAWYVRRDAVKGLEDSLIELGQMLPENAPMLSVLGALDIFNILYEAGAADVERREPLRLSMIENLTRLGEYVDPKDPSLARWNFGRDIPGHIRDQITRLQGPAIRGQLIGHRAPELDFIWTNGDRELKSLTGLSGKVVVMDFWATWCGPCIASFPQMRELVAHYEGSPVEFLGVTSLQGAHYQDGKQTDCTDDPDKEFELMEGFIEAFDMTWTVAYSEQPVYNPEFNIEGIPHIVILDEEGTVRVVGLHPYNDHEEVVEIVDGLLRDMGHKPPAPDPTKEWADPGKPSESP